MKVRTAYSNLGPEMWQHMSTSCELRCGVTLVPLNGDTASSTAASSTARRSIFFSLCGITSFSFFLSSSPTAAAAHQQQRTF
jgi:hypothetical protein